LTSLQNLLNKGYIFHLFIYVKQTNKVFFSVQQVTI
jgi:hypothetical protein